jgi:MFS family permease
MSERQGNAATTQRRRSLWRHADFMKLWTGETISQLGTQVTMLALPTTAILVLNASPFEVGLLTTLEFLPFILVGLPAGVWVDRLHRRPVLIAGDIGRVVALGSIPLAYELNVLHMIQLYLVAFVTGVFTVFFDVAYQAYLPSLVDREDLVDGNGKLEISRSGAQLAGPGLAGILIQILTAPVAIMADAISYVGSALFVWLIRTKEPSIEEHPGGRPKMRAQIKEGLAYVWRHPLLRPIAFCTGSSNLFSSMIMAVLLLFAYRQLHLKPGVVGLALAVGNVGFLVGAFLAGSIDRRFGPGRTIVGSILLCSFGWLAIPFATHSTGPALLALSGLIGGLGVVYNVSQVSLRQAITPHRMQGRMNATMRFMVWGTMPIGSFVGGILGNTIGLRPTLWIGAIGGLLAFVFPFFSPVRKLREIPAATEGNVDDQVPHDPGPGIMGQPVADGAGVIEPGNLPPAAVGVDDG